MTSLKHLIVIGMAVAAAGCNSDRDNRTTGSNTDYRSRDTSTYSGTTGAASTGATDSSYGNNSSMRESRRSNPGSNTSISGNSSSSSTSGAGTSSGTMNVSPTDRNFVNEAASGGMFEVQSSQTAAQKNLSPDLMQVAQMMVTDHTKANQELKDLALRKNITVSQKLQPKHQSLIDRLQNASTDQFATQYRTIQIQAHQETIALFQREARDGQDPDLKSFAQRTLPTLQKHLDHLQRTSPSGNMGDMKNPSGTNRMPDMPESTPPTDNNNPNP